MTRNPEAVAIGRAGRPFDSLTIFTFLWATGILTHQGFHRQFVLDWHDLLLNTLAISALVRPSSLTRLVLLWIAVIVEVTIEMPLVVNHWLLAGIASLTALTVVASGPGRRADGSTDRAALYHALAPPLRLVILLVYGFAFLAKLNWDFLDPYQSCANMLYPWMARRVGFLPTAEWTRMPVIWATLAIEGAIPLLLLFRRTRVAGALIAFLFHLGLGLAGFYDFSGLAAPFLMLFLPDDLPGRLRRWLPASLEDAGVAHATKRILETPPAVPLAVAAVYVVMRNVGRIAPTFSFTMTIWFVGAVLMLTMAILALRARPVGRPASHLRPARAAWLLGPILVVVNGLSPYLGLKTEHSFIMFSNLSTEGPHWNHLFVPRAVRVFGLQDDLVRILGSSERHMRRYAQRRRVLVDYAFRWLVSHYPDASVVYERKGRRYSVDRIGDDPVLSERPGNAFLAKLLHFKLVRAACTH